MSDSLAKARKIAQLKTEECQHCHFMFSKGNILKHTLFCERVTKAKCKVCGKQLTAEQVSYGNITCSVGCYNRGYRRGADHANFKPEKYRNACFAAHKHQCIICGEDKIVHVHHVDENRENNSAKNLVPLCPTHHAYVHSKYKYLINDKIKTYIDSISG